MCKWADEWVSGAVFDCLFWLAGLASCNRDIPQLCDDGCDTIQLETD